MPDGGQSAGSRSRMPGDLGAPRHGVRAGRPRDSHLDCLMAIRQALKRAIAYRITRRQHRVLEAIIVLVTSYSRLVDDVMTAQIAQAAGLVDADGRAGESAVRHVRDELSALAGLGIIVYEPSTKGRGIASRVGLPKAIRGSDSGPPSAPSGSKKGVRSEAERGSDSGPPPEEVLPRERSLSLSAPRDRGKGEGGVDSHVVKLLAALPDATDDTERRLTNYARTKPEAAFASALEWAREGALLPDGTKPDSIAAYAVAIVRDYGATRSAA